MKRYKKIKQIGRLLGTFAKKNLVLKVIKLPLCFKEYNQKENNSVGWLPNVYIPNNQHNKKYMEFLCNTCIFQAM